MASLEQEIMEKVRQMDDSQKAQLLAHIDGLQSGVIEAFDGKAWLESARLSREQLRIKHGEDFRVDIQSLLDEVREEPMDERLGRR